MNDLALWRRLCDGTADAAALRALGELPPAERVSYLGLVLPLLGHDDAAVRAGAVAALAGAAGLPALRALVAALNDVAEEVRRAAVEALRVSATDDPPRWAHALFHPDDGVRRAACAGESVAGAEAYLFYLLADPACADEARQRLTGRHVEASMLPTLLGHVHTGLLSVELARALIAALSWSAILQELARGRTRDPVAAAAVLASGGRGGPIPPDDLDEVVELFWDVPTAQQGDPGTPERFFHGVARALLVASQPVVMRTLAALMATAERRGGWAAGPAEVCAAFHPEFFGFAWIPFEQRRQAVRALYEVGTQAPKRPDAFVRALVESELCRRPTGRLDLYVVGGLLHLLKNQPYKRLQQWVGLDAIVAAFLEDVAGSLPLLGLTDNSAKGRAFLINAIAQRQAPGDTSLLAFLILAGSADDWDFLQKLPSGRAVEVFAELIALTRANGVKLTETRLNRLGELLGGRIVAETSAVESFLTTWLGEAAPEEIRLGLRVLGELARTLSADALTDTARALPAERLRKFLIAVAWCSGFPYGKEVHLAHALASHSDKDVRDWAGTRIPPEAARAAAPAEPTRPGALATVEKDQLAGCRDAELPALVARLLARPRAGLCEALARRHDPPSPCVDVCVALLAAPDPLERVDRQLARFGSEDVRFLRRLEEAVVHTWLPCNELSVQGSAWLYRWESPHGYTFAANVLDAPGGLGAVMRRVASLSWAPLRRRFWAALSRLHSLAWAWSDRERLRNAVDDELPELLVEALTTPEGDEAAALLVRLRPAELRARVVALLPTLAPAVVKALSGWIDTTGLVLAPEPARPLAPPPVHTLHEIATLTDIDALAQCCLHSARSHAEAAAMRLVALGERGVARLLRLLRGEVPSANVPLLAATVASWPKGSSRAALPALVADVAVAAHNRFRVGRILANLGTPGLMPHLIDAACTDAAPPWFRPDDWRALLTLGVSAETIAARLARSPQATAYTPAIEHLISLKLLSAEGREALRAFLNAETPRLHELRVKAAWALHRIGALDGFPLLLRLAVAKPEDAADLLSGVPGELVDLTVAATLTAGLRLVPEANLLKLLDDAGIDPAARDHALARLLAEATAAPILHQVLGRLRHSPARARKLAAVAKTFAWGIHRGRELTGTLFAVEMLAGDDLGYTKLEQNKVFINALPILRGEQDGRAVVEGLLLHELGHHIYHKGEGAAAVWKEAADAKLFPLLNLVSDEHLERNLRAVCQGHGDRLKKLNAYAFQHAVREVPVAQLLDGLQGRALAVLGATRLGVARKRGCVAVESGAVLAEMERAGLSFPRFMRALRMGLGNRHDDPKVAQALALFKKGFRRSSMPALLAIARELRAIFGWEVKLLECLGGDGVCGADAHEVLRVGEGISNEELQEAIQRALEAGKESREGKPVQLLNVSPDESFQTITTIVRVPADRAAHARYAVQVARPARQMRRWLDRLGLALEPQRYRVRGKRVDRGRIPDVVLRGDPRLLIAREMRVQTDLFLGVVIDCSGSMQIDEKIERAKLFGTLLAEAARGMRGLDLRLYGFTDSVIYDAGDAAHCAVHALRAGGGNNDAAALWHAALAARASRRRAKLLVMISDGLPTECSVAALRALVTRLTNRLKMCCAQVAVQPLEEVTFPHYVVLDETDPEASVRRFGEIIARLVRRALQGG